MQTATDMELPYGAIDVPDRVWHVTTRVRDVLSTGRLLTQNELHEEYHGLTPIGLGGARGDRISVTESLSIAEKIQEGLLWMVDIARGYMDVEHLAHRVGVDLLDVIGEDDIEDLSSGWSDIRFHLFVAVELMNEGARRGNFHDPLFCQIDAGAFADTRSRDIAIIELEPVEGAYCWVEGDSHNHELQLDSGRHLRIRGVID